MNDFVPQAPEKDVGERDFLGNCCFRLDLARELM
jgi:hypothetical protein